MADHEIGSVAIAPETGNFCWRDATTNLPDVALADAALADKGWAVERGNFFDSPEQAVVEMDLTRADFNEQLVEPIGIVNKTGADYMGIPDGEMIPVIRGGIQLKAPLNNIGDTAGILGGGGTPAYLSHDLLPWVEALVSNYGLLLPAAATDTVVAGVDAAEYEPTNPADYVVGQGIVVVRNNAVETAFVSEVDLVTPAIKLSTELPGGVFAGGETIRHCATLYPQSGTAGTPFTLRFDMDGKRMYAFGCKVAGFSLVPESGAIVGVFSIVPTIVLRDDANAATETYTPPDGFMVQELQGCSVIVTGNTRTEAAPGKQAVQEFNVDSWEVEITSAGHREPDKKWLGGASDMSISGAQPRIRVSMPPDEDIEATIRKRETKTLALVAGPAGPGEGLVFWAGAVQRTSNNMGITNEEGRQVQAFELRCTTYNLDTGAGAPANKAWRLALPM